jgi:hypothetical protein
MINPEPSTFVFRNLRNLLANAIGSKVIDALNRQADLSHLVLEKWWESKNYTGKIVKKSDFPAYFSRF